MNKPRTFITQEFIQRILEDGDLAEACARLSQDPRDDLQPLPRLGTWELICEEIVDTEYEDQYYDRVVAELHHRGFADEEIRQMRKFAWETAGWLNFEKMLWDWVSLTASDIRLAIQWQLKEGEITESESKQMEAYLEKYENDKGESI